MPITPTYPGIYIQELPSTAHTITAAPTSITVFVGYTHPYKTLWDPASLWPGATTNYHGPVEIFSFADYEREFGGFYLSNAGEPSVSNALDGNIAYAVNEFFQNGGADAFVVGVQPRYWKQDPITQQWAFASNVLPAQLTAGGITFTALEPTDATHQMTVTINNLRPSDSNSPSIKDMADIIISYGTVTETYRRVTINPNAPPNDKANYIENRIYTPRTQNAPEKRISTLVTIAPSQPPPPPPAPPPSHPYGPSFSAETAAPLTLATAPDPAWITFSSSDFAPVFETDKPLDKLQIFNLMAIPGIVNNAVLSEALAFCERKLAFLVMDPPNIDVADSASADYVGHFIDQTGDSKSNIAPLSQNGALYFPYLKSADPLTGNTVDLPPSGFVTGIYARTDLNRGVWKAPAGLETTILDTTGVVDSGKLTDNRHGVLNIAGVNCLRTFPTGTVVFGARTLVSSNVAFQQWKYVPVRRMALFIEQTLYQNLKWVIFEPNDEPLWAAIRTTINNFMLSLFNQGALQGSKPSEAFQVKCDSTTTTPDDVTNGIVNIIVAFAPLRPAEFVIIKIAQLAGQVQQ